ncbi:MAG: universal stress protein [Betaproteobacteria bacterium]|nr:universal stress protein [Betaproteobacteria bacterium]
MYKNILIAIDGSPVSDAALHHAIALAQDQRAHLHVVHVVDIMGMPWADLGESVEVDMPAIYRQQGQSILQRALAQAAQAGLPATSTLLESESVGQRVAELLADQARSVAADLVVLGSHGYRGLSRLFLGSVAEGTSRLSSVPVLIVHGTAAHNT